MKKIIPNCHVFFPKKKLILLPEVDSTFLIFASNSCIFLSFCERSPKFFSKVFEIDERVNPQ